MVAVYNIDPKTISWVREEINITLEDTKSALEAYLVNPDDVVRMEMIADSVHKICGAVEMVEIFGAVLIAREMELVARGLIKDEITLKDEAMDALMRGMLQLPAYLTQLYHGNKDIPLVLLPLLNDMRAVQDKPLLTESAFFSPNLAALKPVGTDDDGPTTWDIKTIAKKLRPVYLSGLLGFFKGEKVKKSLRMLATVIMNIENASTQKKTEQIWWVSAGVVHALYDKGLEPSVAVKLLLGKVDRQIKKLIDHGETILSTEPPHDLMKNLLYYVGRSSSGSTRVRELKIAFNLTDSLPDTSAITLAQDELIGFNANLMENMTSQLKEELLRIKDSLDVALHVNRGESAELTPVVERLRSVADALGMLGLTKLRKLIKKQEAFISNLIQQDNVLDNEDVIQIARVLLYIESSLYDLNLREEASEVIDDKEFNELSMLPEAEYIHVVDTTVQESLNDLNKIKDAIERFSLSTSNHDILVEVPQLMGLVKGAVKMLSHPRVVGVIEATAEYIEHEVYDKKSIPDEHAFDLLANAIVGIEYYLEGILQKAVTSNSAIEIAELSLANLGYAPQKLAADKIIEDLSDQENAYDDESEIVTLVPAVVSDVDEAEVEINPEVDEELVSIFLVEAGDELEEISSSLEKWKEDQSDNESLGTLIRSFHTLKGAGRIVGSSSIGLLAWSIEELLRRIQDERILPSEAIIELLEQTVPMITQLIIQMKNGEDEGSTDNIQPLIDTARELRESKQATG